MGTRILALLGLLPCVLAGPEALAATPGPVQQVASFAAPATPAQMAYSSPYGLLFIFNAGSVNSPGSNSLRVIDAGTHTQIDQRTANWDFTDMSLSPSGRYLYAADFGGENIGYGTPMHQSYVQRYDLQTRTWSTGLVPWIAYHVEAVDDSRVLFHSSDQWTAITLNSFGATATQLAKYNGSLYYGDIRYDWRTGRIYHGNSGLSSQEINVCLVTGNALSYVGGTGIYGTAQGYGGSAVLSTDGKEFYYGRLEVDAANVNTHKAILPNVIMAATGSIGFATTGTYYDAANGASLGSLGYATNVYALSADGNYLWAYQSTGNILNEYTTPEPATLALLALGGLAMIALRRRAKR